CEIERRPRGASRAALAPTFVSGQLCLWDLRANALAHGAISRRTNKRIASCARSYVCFGPIISGGFARERLGAWRDIASYKQGGRARLSQA
ncbi:hypothetical protein, partial [Pseudomonas putida]|uniref:hypothetical protein n=1 Tax=Pseudomonas putida TaxID=303 RepID=UPI002B24BF3F